jgi:hypothetical protein
MEATQGSKHTERVEQVNEKVDNLGVIIKAMWSLLEENGYTAEQLLDRIEEIELQRKTEAEDGIPAASRCRKCDSMVAKGLPNCQYCGEPMAGVGRHPLSEI